MPTDDTQNQSTQVPGAPVGGQPAAGTDVPSQVTSNVPPTDAPVAPATTGAPAGVDPMAAPVTEVPAAAPTGDAPVSTEPGNEETSGTPPTTPPAPTI